MTEEEFDELRPSAFAIAYQMLDSASEAEDVVQEGFLRLPGRAPAASGSSRRAPTCRRWSRVARPPPLGAGRRETYVGEWLPEPLVTSADDDPASNAEIADSLSLAVLVLLESLSPEQRAAFLLREVFDEPYDRIAEIVGTSEQNARQLATRAQFARNRPHPFRLPLKTSSAEGGVQTFIMAVDRDLGTQGPRTLATDHRAGIRPATGRAMPTALGAMDSVKSNEAGGRYPAVALTIWRPPDMEFVFEPEGEGGYHGYAPELPGLHTQGENLEEATANAEEALALYVEGMREEGRSLEMGVVRRRLPLPA